MTAAEILKVQQLLAPDRAQLVKRSGSAQLGDSELQVMFPNITEELKDVCERALLAYTWPKNFPATLTDPLSPLTAASVTDPVIRSETYKGTWTGIEPSLEWGPTQLNQLTREVTQNLLWTLRRGSENVALEKGKEYQAGDIITTQTDHDMAAAAVLPTVAETGKIRRRVYAKDKTGRYRNTEELREAVAIDTGWLPFSHQYSTGYTRVMENYSLASIVSAAAEKTGMDVSLSPMTSNYPDLFSCRLTATSPGGSAAGDNWNDYVSSAVQVTEEQYHWIDDEMKRRTRQQSATVKQTKSRATAYTYAGAAADDDWHLTEHCHVEIYGGGTRFRAVRVVAENNWTEWASNTPPS